MYKWHGISKLVEECAELTTELAKLQAYPDGKHPDEHYAGPLLERVHNELGDVLAAINFFCTFNEGDLDWEKIMDRKRAKYTKLIGYHMGTDGMQGVWVPSPKDRDE